MAPVVGVVDPTTGFAAPAPVPTIVGAIVADAAEGAGAGAGAADDIIHATSSASYAHGSADDMLEKVGCGRFAACRGLRPSPL